MKVERFDDPGYNQKSVIIHLTERIWVGKVSRNRRARQVGFFLERSYLATDNPPLKSYTAICWRVMLPRVMIHGSFPISRSKSLQ